MSVYRTIGPLVYYIDFSVLEFRIFDFLNLIYINISIFGCFFLLTPSNINFAIEV